MTCRPTGSNPSISAAATTARCPTSSRISISHRDRLTPHCRFLCMASATGAIPTGRLRSMRVYCASTLPVGCSPSISQAASRSGSPSRVATLSIRRFGTTIPMRSRCRSRARPAMLICSWRAAPTTCRAVSITGWSPSVIRMAQPIRCGFAIRTTGVPSSRIITRTDWPSMPHSQDRTGSTSPR